ncbi:Protein Tax-1 [Quaeritorhiza haematococci]|nr:Protein Tax-1 [Quaeritorhiza haematococci]
MYKVEIVTPADQLQQAAIDRRRRLDEERKKRIFDPRARILGIDVKTLEEQIKTKNEMKSTEKARKDAFDKQIIETNTLLQALDHHQQTTLRSHLQLLNNYRLTHQPPPTRREWDLNDPDRLKHLHPPRSPPKTLRKLGGIGEIVVGALTDEEMRMGCEEEEEKAPVSGCQMFEGEDEKERVRRREQCEQMKTWVKEQMWEQEKRRREEEEEKRSYEEFQGHVVNKTTEMQKMLEKAKAERARQELEFNRSLAEQRRQKEKEEREKELKANISEINGHLNGEFLTERPDVFNIGGGHRVRVDMFKGITPEQKRNILWLQELQREEAEARREYERQEEQEWALQQESNLHASMLLEQEKLRRQREMAIKTREENRKKAEEDRERRQYIDKVLYTNPPQESYFSQFNTTHR